MPTETNATGEVIYLVTFEQIYTAELAVPVAGPAGPEARAGAIRLATADRPAGTAIAWAAVGDPDVAPLIDAAA